MRLCALLLHEQGSFFTEVMTAASFGAPLSKETSFGFLYLMCTYHIVLANCFASSALITATDRIVVRRADV